MPRLSITLPDTLYKKITELSADNKESLSNIIIKMTELGLSVSEKKLNNNATLNFSEVEAHCYKLTIQMNAIIKNLAAEKLGYSQIEFEKLRDLSINKFNELIGISPEEL